MHESIVVTGAAGKIGNVGRRVTELLLAQGTPVRSIVHIEDERAARLRKLGAEVVVVDLTRPEEIYNALQGCKRVFFCMGVSAEFLEATTAITAAARTSGIEMFVNLSQMTVSSMDITHSSDSRQQRLHWLGEQTINWSGIPTVHLRPTVFQEHPMFCMSQASLIKTHASVVFPFGNARTSPIAAQDVAEVATKILLEPEPTRYIGQVVELTGPSGNNSHRLAAEYSEGFGRPISNMDISLDNWETDILTDLPIPDFKRAHLLVMAKRHADHLYDKHTDTVEQILGRLPRSLAANIQLNPSAFLGEPFAELA